MAKKIFDDRQLRSRVFFLKDVNFIFTRIAYTRFGGIMCVEVKDASMVPERRPVSSQEDKERERDICFAF
jgi:hypothetical protein